MGDKNITKKIEEAFPERNDAVKNKLFWFEERCVLENCIKNDKGEPSREGGENLFSGFMQNYYCDNNEIDGDKIKNAIHKPLDDPDNIENKFYDYLDMQTINEDEVKRFWNDNAKKFINKLNNYRENGTMDNNISGKLLDFAKNINNDGLRYIYELIQNADDCDYKEDNKTINIRIIDSENSSRIEVSYNEIGMTYSDIIAITTIGQSNKKRKKKKRIIGEKGIGFKTIFSVCNKADIHSGNYHFTLSESNFRPEWIDTENREDGTKLTLYLKDKIGDADNSLCKGNTVFDAVLNKYGIDSKNGKIDIENAFKNCPIMFTNKLTSIEIEYKSDKENNELKVRKIKIERTSASQLEDELTIKYFCYDKNNSEKEEKYQEPFEENPFECFKVSRDIKLTYEEYTSRYKNIFKDKSEFDNCDKDAITYPIVILAPKETKDIKMGNIYSYLPTYTNIKAPISVQLPVELNLDRSCMWINGLRGEQHTPNDLIGDSEDRKTTKWNKRMFEELFVGIYAQKSLMEEFYDTIKKKTDVFNYIPSYKDTNYKLFFNSDKTKTYAKCIEALNEYCGNEKENVIYKKYEEMKLFQAIPVKCGEIKFCNCKEALMFDGWITDTFLTEEFLSNEENYTKIKSYVKLDENNKKKETEEQWQIVKYNAIAEEKMRAFKFKKVEIGERVEFVNYLVQLNRNKVLEKYNEELENKSDYLIYDEDIKKVKMISTLGKNYKQEYRAYESSFLWLNLLGKINIPASEHIAIYKQSNNQIESDSKEQMSVDAIINKILGDQDLIQSFSQNQLETKNEIWNYIFSKIRTKKGNKIKIECPYQRFVEIMDLMRKLENSNADQINETSSWYEYTKKILEDKENIEDEEMKKNVITLLNARINPDDNCEDDSKSYREEVKPNV